MVYFIGPGDSSYNRANINQCFNYCKNKKVLGLDTETTGFDPFVDKMIMLQIGDDKTQFVIDTRYQNIDLLKPIIESKEIKKILWNAKFDYKFIKSHLNIDLSNLYDGMIVERILNTSFGTSSDLEEKINGIYNILNEDQDEDEDISYSLDAACLKYLNKKLNKEYRDKFIGMSKDYFTDEAIKYGAEDIENLVGIREQQLKIVEKEDLLETVKLENDYVEVLADNEYIGMHLDVDKWMELNKEYKELKEKSKKEMEQWIVDNNIEKYIDKQLDFFDISTKALVHNARGTYLFSSPKDTVAFLKHIGVEAFERDKKTGENKPTAGAKALIKFKNNSFVSIYLKYKVYSKLVSTYGEDFLKNIHPITGRVHSNFWQIKNTGRIGSTNPNMQNIPAGPLRECFTETGDDVLIVGDFAAQEPRILADKCKDKALVDFYLNGHGDIHSFVTSRMMSVIENTKIDIPPKIDDDEEALKKHKEHPYSKYRSKGKMLNLKLDYGGSAFTTKDDLEVETEEEAQVFIDALAAAFPEKQDYFKKVTYEALAKGYIETNPVTKRKLYLSFHKDYLKLLHTVKKRGFWDKYKSDKTFKKKYKDLVSTYFKLKGKIERLAKNAPIQGTAADMTKLAAVNIRKRFKEENLNSYLILSQHDELVAKSSKKDAEKAKQIMKEGMENAGKTFCQVIPQFVNPVITNIWTH